MKSRQKKGGNIIKQVPIRIDDEPYFVGKEVAKILGYSNSSKAVSSHVDEEDKRFIMINIADSQNGNVRYI